jgi:adenylyltransferase/sulfurtransferase
MATVLIPTSLRKFTENVSRIEIDAQTIGNLLGNLSRKYPDLKKYLYAAEGQISNFIKNYLEDEAISDTEIENTFISPNHVIRMVAPDTLGMDNVTFSREELGRYNRHIIIPEFGMEAQKKLKNARVLVVGSGGLGSPLLLYLAAAGVGTIGIVDFDIVEDSNLHRQVLFGVDEIGIPKVEAAKKRLEGINPYIKIHAYNEKISSKNALELIAEYDVVADGTDNFPTRYLVNDACVLSGKTNVYASVFQFEGQVSVFNYTKNGVTGPNYRDLYETPPPAGLVPNCAESGVLGVLPGIIGSLQALEVIKVVTGVGEVLSVKLYTFDALSFQSITFKVGRKESNPLNGANPTITDLIDYEEFCNIGLPERAVKEINAGDLNALLEGTEKFQLIDVREPYEFDLVNISGELIPLGSVIENYQKIKQDMMVVVHCKVGGRSAKAIRDLEDHFGFENLYNLKGGIIEYLKNYEPDLEIY